MNPSVSETLRIAGLELESVVDGPGIRAVVFTQGCPHHCEGCHNPETHDPEGGSACGVDELTAKLTQNPRIKGITLSGGEPLIQAPAALRLIRQVREICPHFDFMLYTGYTWEWVMEAGDGHQKALVSEMTLVVDGPFIQARRNLELRFRGSDNQRVLDVQASLQSGAPVPWRFETYFGLT